MSTALRLAFGLLVALTLVASGCKRNFETPRQFVDQLKEEWRAFTSGKTFAEYRAEQEREAEAAKLDAQAGKLSREAELVQELYRVVLQTAPRKAEFLALVSSVSQGASLEGIYNGLVSSTRFRKLEEQGPARAATLALFAEELTAFQRELAERYPISRSSRNPRQPPVPIGLESPTPEALASDAPIPEPGDPGLWKSHYMKLFEGASAPTLRRVLGEVALAVISAKKSHPESLAAWYGGFAIRSAGRGVHLGLALRSKADEAFHREWAKSASIDALTWEVLNRVHRLLSEVDSK